MYQQGEMQKTFAGNRAPPASSAGVPSDNGEIHMNLIRYRNTAAPLKKIFSNDIWGDICRQEFDIFERKNVQKFHSGNMIDASGSL